MSARIHNFRIGLFVLIGALLFIGGLFAMGLKSYFGSKVVFETYVPGKVENLSVGALVKLRGVTIGKVSSIDFVGVDYPGYDEQAVVVRFEVPSDFPWAADTNTAQAMLDKEVARGLRARVQGQGFLGASIVALEYVDPQMYPVEPVPWIPKHYHIPSAPNQFNRVLTSLEKSLRHVEDLDVTNLLARAQKLVDAADDLVNNINRVNFDQLGTNANALVAEFRQTNKGIERTLADAQGAIKDADLAGIRRDTGALETKLTATALQAKHLLAGIDTGTLNETLANVRAATDELIDLLNTLEQRPSAVVFSKGPKPVTELSNPPKK